MKAKLRYLLIGVLTAVVAAAVLLFTPLGKGPLSTLFPVGVVERVDFAAFKLPDKTNQFLMCPIGFCAANPHTESPVFDVPAAQLRARWREFAASQPRTELLAEDADAPQADYVQRSARFRFPDIITVRFIPISTSRSTLAIYSRSIYGRSDFGVNRKRIDAWLRTFRAALEA